MKVKKKNDYYAQDHQIIQYQKQENPPFQHCLLKPETPSHKQS